MRLVAYSKTEYYIVKGVQHGTSYDCLKAFEDQVNRKFPPKQKNLRFQVVFIPVPRNQLLPGLAAGKGDIALGALTVTQERLKSVDFSDPIATGIKEIVVSGPNTELHTVDDLSGQEVFVRKSSSYWEHLQSLNQKFRAQGKSEVRLQPAPEDLEDEDLLEMLNAGLVPLLVTDGYLPNLWSKVYTNIRSHRDIVIHDSGDFAWAMRKNSPQLMAVVNDFMKTHKLGTAFGNSMVGKYYSSTQLLKNIADPVELKKFQDTIAMFQRYSSQYDVDYLLMMAEGYQESGLNQQVRSKGGAIGIMQLMPSTGRSMAVGDIHRIDPNIHAGVKYVRFMVNKYFANEPMTDTNKLLFAFAAYNMGPNRLQALRAEAARQGLDPNVWMDNVELIAAARIGIETVQYVSNIYKYYIAYKLVEEHQQLKGKALEQIPPKSSSM